MEADPEG
jgi:salicylate hydroxylase